MYRQWTCTGSGHVQAVDMYRQWTCTGSGHVQAVDMYRQWTCAGSGHVQAVDMYRQWTCTGSGHVQAVGSRLVAPAGLTNHLHSVVSRHTDEASGDMFCVTQRAFHLSTVYTLLVQPPAWLSVMPSEDQHLHLDSSMLQVALRLWLSLDLSRSSTESPCMLKLQTSVVCNFDAPLQYSRLK